MFSGGEDLNFIEAFSTIKPTAYPTVQTMDMGLEFVLFTKDGAYSELGCFGAWPLHRFGKISDADRQSILSAIEDGNVTLDLLRTTGLFGVAEMIEKHQNDAGENPLSPSDLLELLAPLKAVLPRANGWVFAYCDTLAWGLEIEFFASYDELEKYFLELYPVTPWSEWSEEFVKGCYNAVVTEKVEGLSLRSHDKSEPVCHD